MNTVGRTARALGWTLCLVGAIVVLRAAATGDLASPPFASLDALGDWSDARDPATTAMALVRFLTEIGVWYLLGLTVLHGLAGVLRSGGTRSLADALALPGAQRLVRGGLGLGLLATTTAGAGSPTDDAARAPSTATMQPEPSATDGSAWMVPETTPTAEAATPTLVRPVPPGPSTPGTWTVADGESLWSIAEDALAETVGREPSDREVDPYWRALIDLNRDRLIDPDDPGLIHPGQVFELPVAVR